MKQWLSILLSILLSAGLLLYPFAGFAQDYGLKTSQKQEAPPVAQTLVREGDFAIKLAAELDLGNPANEVAAEEMLAKAGVSPLNGWLSDYPMTPEIIGQLEDSIAAAAGQGKLPMTAGEANKGLYYLASQMNLPTPASSGAGTAPEGQSNPTVVNNYYYDQGPPVISYYPPPADYVYLYDWVPFPVFWFGFWFPGFFICHNFTTTVIVSNTGFVSRTAIVSNRFIDPVTRTVTRIDPVVRTSTGTVRPMTALRTGSGQLFRTATDMRHGVTLSGVSPVRTGTSTGSAGRGGFRTLEARRGAQSIYSRSVQKGPERTMTRSSGTRSNTAPGRSGRSYNNAPRSYSAPARGYEGRSTQPSSPSRSYNRPVMRDGGYGRSYGAPSAPQRSYSGPVTRSGGVTKPYPGTGWRGRM